MKNLLIILCILHFQVLFPQREGMVLIQHQYKVEVDGHIIRTNDVLAKSVVREFFTAIDQNRISYQKKLRFLKGVFMVDRPKSFISDEKKGRILIGNYVNRFPRTKRILILNRLAIFFGAHTFGGSSYSVLNENFILNEKTERIYSLPGRIKRKVDMRYIIEELEKRSPLNTKIH